MADWLRPSAICAPRKLLCSTTARKTASERRSDWASCIPCPYISLVNMNLITFLFFCTFVHALLLSRQSLIKRNEAMKRVLNSNVLLGAALAAALSAPAASAADLLEKIKAEKVIIVATEARFAPFEFVEDGKIVGY